MKNHQFPPHILGSKVVVKAAEELAKRLGGKLKTSILPEKAEDWTKLPLKQFRILWKAKERYDDLAKYRTCLNAGMTQKQAAAKVERNVHTLCNWDKRERAFGQAGLLAQSTARKTQQARDKRTQEVEDFVAKMRQESTRGRKTLREDIYDALGEDLSYTSIGRILRDVFEKERPGWLQMDHKKLKVKGYKLIIFAAIDVFTREVFVLVAVDATALSALRALDHFQRLAGYPITDVQTDNGTEFRAEFEAALQARGIEHHLIPPYSPTWNSLIEGWFGYLVRSELNIRHDWAVSVSGLQEFLDRAVADYNAKPNEGLPYYCSKLGRIRLASPNQMRYTHALSTGR